MKLKLILFNLFILFSQLNAQEGFKMEEIKNKVTIPFQFINNLIIIPVEVNGVSLNFLLDTGVEETILFSLDETEEISFAHIEKIKIRGFGNRDPFEGLKSINNTLNIKGFKDVNHTLYLVLDQEINISSQVGIPVNGIIGHHFFDKNLVKIDYSSKKITIYKNTVKQSNKFSKSFSKAPIEIQDGKPYMLANVMFDGNNKYSSNLLIDIGNSDAIWLFKNKNPLIKMPSIFIEDFLGRGFGGDVFGKRARISKFEVANFTITNPLVAFPDDSNLEGITLPDDRLGSIGSEIMSRFTIVFDYKSKFIYLKKNNSFNNPFNYNMSGLEIQHQGLQWVKESYEENPAIANNLLDSSGERVAGNFKYRFELKPIYVISNVRKGSPAGLSGLKRDDIIVSINGNKCYKYTLQEINQLIKSQDEKALEFTIDRNGTIMLFKFQLKTII